MGPWPHWPSRHWSCHGGGLNEAKLQNNTFGGKVAYFFISWRVTIDGFRVRVLTLGGLNYEYCGWQNSHVVKSNARHRSRISLWLRRWIVSGHR